VGQIFSRVVAFAALAYFFLCSSFFKQATYAAILFRLDGTPTGGIIGVSGWLSALGSYNSLPTGDCLSASPLCSSVGLCSLSPDRQAPAVAYTPKRLNIRKSPDVQLCFTPKVTLYQQARSFDGAANTGEVFVGKVPGSCRVTHANVAHDFFGCGAPDAIDSSQCDFEPLVVWNVYAGDYRHGADSPVLRLALPRLEAGGLLVDHIDAAFTANDFAAGVLCLD
jgi:hypothetical protein